MITKMLMTFFYLKLKVNIKSSGIIKYIKNIVGFIYRLLKLVMPYLSGIKHILKILYWKGNLKKNR